MNYCNLKDLQEIPLTNGDNNIFMDNSRDFTIYETSNFYLQQFAKKYNLEINTNEFRNFLQKNPDKLFNLIKYYKEKDIIYLPQK